MEPFITFSSRLVSLPNGNIDTDQIVPARFLKATDKAGLAEALFADWRFNPDGTPKPDFVLNHPTTQGARILLAGDNFGCGSSREHAPWALVAFGFRAVVSTSFADIFRNNALKNGLLPVVVDRETHRQLFTLVEEDPVTEVEIDLAGQTLRLADGRAVAFPIDGFARRCLLDGVDEMGYLLALEPKIAAYEVARSASGSR